VSSKGSLEQQQSTTSSHSRWTDERGPVRANGPVINTLLILLVGLAIHSSFSGKTGREDDHNQSRYADINAADIPTCADFLTEVGLTIESA
jgi:hypothetical protein